MFLGIRAPTRSHQTFHLLHRSHCGSPTADPHVTNFCHQTLARVAPPSDMDAISCQRRCPIHFDLTADDSEEECLLVAIQIASRSRATYSATLSRSECRWPTRRRVTCLTGLAEEQHFPTVDPVSPEQPDLLAMGWQSRLSHAVGKRHRRIRRHSVEQSTEAPLRSVEQSTDSSLMRCACLRGTSTRPRGSLSTILS